MANEKELTELEFQSLKITYEEEEKLILERERFDKIARFLDIAIEERTPQHDSILGQHLCTLTFSSIRYDVDLADKLSINIISNEKFGTPLIYAIRAKKFNLAESLLKYTDQYINFTIDGKTALAYAALYNQTDLERKIIKKGGTVLGVELILEKTPSQMREDLLASFRGNKLLSENITSSDPLARFLRVCRIDDKAIMPQFPLSHLETLYTKDKTFYLLISLSAYIHETRNTHIFFCNIKYRNIVNLSQNKIIGFVDSVSKNIFCFYYTDVSLEDIATCIHECAHLAIFFIYNNYSPYNTEEDEKEFGVIVNTIQGQLPFLINLENSHGVSQIISVYRDYEKQDWPEELIVRVPELLTSLGIQQGLSLLQQYFPLLIEYYYKKIIPRIYCFLILGIDPKIQSHYFLMICQQMEAVGYNESFGKIAWEQFHQMILKLSIKELSDLKKIALFFEVPQTLVSVCDTQLQVMKEQEKRAQRIDKNLSILNELKLNPYENSFYWKQFVKYGGILYDGNVIPHTIAHTFDSIKSLIPHADAQSFEPDCEPDTLLMTIATASGKPSRSWASFFRIPNTGVIVMRRKLETMMQSGQSFHNVAISS